MTNRKGARDPGAEELNGAIARRLGQLRRVRQQSFDELALRTGVSKGMLVQIEQGRANPSIGTLCRLAAGFGVSVVELLSEEDTKTSAIQIVGAEQARLLWKGPKGGSAVLNVGTPGPDMLELWSWTLMPGERYESRAHAAGTVELIHVHSGTLELASEGCVERVPAGACARLDADRPHAYAVPARARTRATFSMVVQEPGARTPSSL